MSRGPSWMTAAASAGVVAQQRQPSCMLLALKKESEGRFFGLILLLFLVLLCFRYMLPATFCVLFPVSDADGSQGLRSLISSIDPQCPCSLLSQCVSLFCPGCLLFWVCLFSAALRFGSGFPGSSWPPPSTEQEQQKRQSLERSPPTATLVSDVANHHRSVPANHFVLSHTNKNQHCIVALAVCFPHLFQYHWIHLTDQSCTI